MTTFIKKTELENWLITLMYNLAKEANKLPENDDLTSINFKLKNNILCITDDDNKEYHFNYIACIDKDQKYGKCNFFIQYDIKKEDSNYYYQTSIFFQFHEWKYPISDINNSESKVYEGRIRVETGLMEVTVYQTLLMPKQKTPSITKIQVIN